MDTRRDAILNGPLVRNVLRFGFPLSIAMGLQACFNLIDLLIIGRLPNGTVAIAALVSCDMLAVVGTIFTQGISNASVAVVSRFFGLEDRRALNHATWTSLFLVALLSLAFGALGYFGADLLIGDMLQATGEVHRIAVSYLKILVGHSWTIFFLLHLTALMRALGSARWPTIILIAANVLNVFLDVILVYGPGPAPEGFQWGGGIASALGIPRMGVDGAAWATVIARGLGCVWAAAVLIRFQWGPRLVRKEMRPSKSELWRLVRIGAPSSAQFLVRISAVLVAIALVARFYASAADPTVYTAFGICIRLDMLGLFMGLGWASGAATFVGINLGADNTARAIKSGWVAAAFNAASMVVLVAVYLGFAPQIIGLFDGSPAVIAVGKEYLRIVGMTYAFIGVAVVLSNALQGATDTVSSFLIDAIVIAGVQIPVMLIVVVGLDAPRTWIWYAIAGANVLSALVYALWYRRGRWTRLQV